MLKYLKKLMLFYLFFHELIKSCSRMIFFSMSKIVLGLSLLRVCQKIVLQSSISEVKRCLDNKNNKHRYWYPCWGYFSKMLWKNRFILKQRKFGLFCNVFFLLKSFCRNVIAKVKFLRCFFFHIILHILWLFYYIISSVYITGWNSMWKI